MKSFLTEIKSHFGTGSYEGDQFGGARGNNGNGLPTGLPNNFMFATGIECSYPTIEHGKIRRDLLRRVRPLQPLQGRPGASERDGAEGVALRLAVL
ncbi:MAG: hypothetical protein WKG07_22950 [Hymenobacter sp.]